MIKSQRIFGTGLVGCVHHAYYKALSCNYDGRLRLSCVNSMDNCLASTRVYEDLIFEMKVSESYWKKNECDFSLGDIQDTF